jgi:polysaccharide export outer membrane protein
MNAVRPSLARAFAVGLSALMALSGATHAQAQTAAPQAQAQPQTAAPAQRTEYVLGSGDVIRITVFQNPDLTLETRLSESGQVSYPLLGQINLGGLSVGQAERRVADGLRSGNFVKQPQVNILVVQVRGNQVSVLGNVNRPGRYPLELADTRLTDILAAAGGVSQGGSDIVTVVGSRNGRPFRTEVDLPGAFQAAQRTNDIILANGDVIYVDRVPTVFIYGEVQRPGVIRLDRGMTVMQALATGGGLTQRGTEKGMRVHRRGPDGKVQVIQPSMDDPVRDGDVVYVRESLF